MSGMNAREERRWQQIRRIRQRRRQLAAARASQTAAEWRHRQGEALRQETEVQQRAQARLRHAATRRQQAGGFSAAEGREGQAWSGELQRRIDDGRRLALLAHAEARQAQITARTAQAGARRAAQDHDRAQQAIDRARARAEAAAEHAEEQQIEDLAPLRWWQRFEG